MFGSAAPPAIAKTVAVVDWDHTVLRKGSGNYVCHPTPPDLRAKGGREPMCMDEPWEKWADAWINKKPFKADRAGVAYMLAGDTGTNNEAAGLKVHEHWVQTGPHVMIVGPAVREMGGYSRSVDVPDPTQPYVMYPGTQYEHLMLPVAAGG